MENASKVTGFTAWDGDYFAFEPQKAVVVDEQIGKLIAGKAGEVTLAVKAYLRDGTYPVTVATLPTGAEAPMTVTITGNQGTLKITGSVLTSPETTTPTVTIDGITSSSFTLTVYEEYTPAAPTVTGPFVYGEKLSKWTLSTDEKGTWAWQGDASQIPAVNNTGYTAKFTVTNPNYTLSGDGTAIVTVTVTKATPVYDVPTGLTAVYGQTLSNIDLPDGWEWYDDPAATSVGNAGTNYFTAIFTPEDTDNYNTATESLSVSVGRAPVARPTIITGLVYNEEEQIGIDYDENSLAYSLFSGDVKATDTDVYTATFELNPNYKWDDGTTTLLVLEWRIANEKGSAEVVMDGFTYDGISTGTPSVVITDGDWNTVAYQYSTDGSVWSGTAPVNAGTYYIRAILTGSASGSYADLTTELVEYAISKAGYTPTAPTVTGSFVYGEELSSWALIWDDPNGIWEWEDDSLIPTVGNTGYTAKFTLTNPNYTLSGDGTVFVTVTVEYGTDKHAIKGDPTGTWAQGSSGGYEIPTDALFSEFVGVKVDGEFIDGDNYDVRSGSVIVTLKETYLRSLSPGPHTVETVFMSGISVFVLDISASSTGSEESGGGGGGSGMIIAVAIVAAIAVVGVAAYFLAVKKK